MNSIWKPVVGYENLYLVSNTGEVKSLGSSYIDKKGRKRVFKAKLLTLHNDKRLGYTYVALSNKGSHKTFRVHTLVAEAFIRPLAQGEVVNHKDFNRQNNSVENLEIISQKENVRHSLMNMKRNSVNNSTGYKHISKRGNKFSVSIKFLSKYYCKNFDNIDAALKYRDSKYEEINYYGQNGHMLHMRQTV